MNTTEKAFKKKVSLLETNRGILIIGLFFLIFICPETIDAQSFTWRKIAKGADTAELYITCYWYDDETTWERWCGVFRSVDNGKTLSVQYKEKMDEGIFPDRYIYGDSTPGTVYMRCWVSRNYGQNWTLKLNPVQQPYFMSEGCMQGEYYISGLTSSGENCLYHFTHYGDSCTMMHDEMVSIRGIESGSLPGELWAIKYPWGGLYEDTLALAYSNDYGQSFTINFIDSSCVTNLSDYTLTSGTEPGELYLIGETWGPQWNICRTTDYGNTFSLQSTFPFDLLDYSFVAGRKPGSFYFMREYLAPSLPLHNCIEIYYSSDYGVTFTLYFHELDSTYTQIPRQSDPTNVFYCYPNPAIDYLQIQLPANEEVSEITFYTLDGEEILSTTIPPFQTSARIDVSTLPSGIYLAKVMQNNRMVGIEKVIVSK